MNVWRDGMDKRERPAGAVDMPLRLDNANALPTYPQQRQKKRRKRLEDFFKEEDNQNGRPLYTLISTAPGPTDGVHLG